MKRKISSQVTQMLSRFTGISTPLGGLQWEPPLDQQRAAGRLLTYLENRRVLFVAHEAEIPMHCVQSAIEMRNFLTEFIGECGRSTEVGKISLGIRQSCIEFCKTVQVDERYIEFGFDDGHFASWVFLPALGAMRAQIGVHLAVLAARFDLKINDDLISILPPEVEDL